MTADDVTLDRLSALIMRAWCAETSADENWTEGNPALGQCAVTALVVQDAFGGELLRIENEGVSHYFNLMKDGAWIDLTRSQFARWAPDFDPEVRQREYVLSFPSTATRYDLLAERIGAAGVLPPAEVES